MGAAGGAGAVDGGAAGCWDSAMEADRPRATTAKMGERVSRAIMISLSFELKSNRRNLCPRRRRRRPERRAPAWEQGRRRQNHCPRLRSMLHRLEWGDLAR